MIKKILSLIIIIIGLMIIGCTQAPEKATGSIPVQQPIANLPEPVETVPEEAGFSISQDIKILGKSGFEPAEISIKKGDKLIWTNEDVQKKNMVLNLRKGTKPTWSKVEVSGLIKVGETYERTFDEAGEYEYWTTAYGVTGKITVTE